jgi:hypothetical protein
MKIEKAAKPKISGKALRQFAENRRIANKAVKKAIEENKKLGIPEDIQFSR